MKNFLRSLVLAAVLCGSAHAQNLQVPIGPGGSGGGGSGGGSGTVISVSVVSANGITGTVANPTTTPAITLTLGAITPSSVTTALGSITTNQKALNVTGTFNAVGTTFDAPIFENIINTASAVGSNIADLQIGGTSVFQLDANTGTAQFSPPTPGTQLTSGGLLLNYSGLSLANLPSTAHYASFDVYGDGNNHAAGFYAYTFGTARSIFVGYNIAGTPASPTATQSGSEMTRVDGRGFIGTSFASGFVGTSAAVSLVAGQNFATNANAGWIGFRTTALNVAAGDTASGPPVVAGVTPSGGMFVGAANVTYSGQNTTTLGTDPGANNLLLFGNLQLQGSGSGTSTLQAAATGGGTATLPAGSGTLAYTSTANVAAVSNSDGTLTISPTTGAVVASIALAHANIWTGNQTISTASFSLSGNISAAAWTTAGIKYANVAGTLTDTSSSGTVAAAYSSVFGGDTIAASSATTYTNYIGVYFKNPVAGTNVTITDITAAGQGYALGADSLIVQASGAAGVNASTIFFNSTTSTQTDILTFTNDTAAGITAVGVVNSAGAGTTLINVANSTIIRNNGSTGGGLYLGTSKAFPVVLFAGGNVTATNAGLTIGGSSIGVTIGSATPAAGQRGDLAQIKETDAAAAPGAGYAVLKWVAGSAGSCNLIAYAGTSTTPVTIASTVGSGC